MFADLAGDALMYYASPWAVAAPVLAATTTCLVVVVIACRCVSSCVHTAPAHHQRRLHRSSIQLPSLLTVGSGGMELHSSPWLCTVWLPSLSQIAMPKVLDLDLATILKTLALPAPPTMPKLQRPSVSAHQLADVSDDEDDCADAAADCSTGHSTSTDACVAWTSPLSPSSHCGAPSASDVGHCPAAVDAVVPHAYLLQFGALIGERDSLQVDIQPKHIHSTKHTFFQQALHDHNLPWAWSRAGTGNIFGRMDGPCTPCPWEPSSDGCSPTASFQAWRLPLRSGFCMWLSETRYMGLTPDDVVRFNLHPQTRFIWDDTAILHETLDCGEPCEGPSCLQQYRCRYPAPLAPRQYVYGRRVWRRPDGGTYIVSRGCPPPRAGLAVPHGRVCAIDDYASCMFVEACHGGVRVVNVYYENPSMPASVTNMAIRKGLWQFTQRHEQALRAHVAACDGEAEYDRVVALECRCRTSRPGGLVHRLARSGSKLVLAPAKALLPALKSRVAAVVVVGLLRGVAAGDQA